MASDLIIAFIGLGGVMLGGALQYVTTALLDHWKYRRDARTAAYGELVAAMANVSIFTGSIGKASVVTMTPEERARFAELQMGFQAAKTKVALYGSRRVLNRIGVFLSRHAAMANDADIEAYLDLIETMRADSSATNYSGFRRDVDNFMLRGMMRA